MLNRIKAAVGTMAITGMLVLPAWAQITLPPPPPPGPSAGCVNIIAEIEPNDLTTPQDFHHLGTLSAGGCVAVDGIIAVGAFRYHRRNFLRWDDLSKKPEIQQNDHTVQFRQLTALKNKGVLQSNIGWPCTVLLNLVEADDLRIPPFCGSTNSSHSLGPSLTN